MSKKTQKCKKQKTNSAFGDPFGACAPPGGTKVEQMSEKLASGEGSRIRVEKKEDLGSQISPFWGWPTWLKCSK